jgi:Spy/CpxP family protein refolding chaperone
MKKLALQIFTIGALAVVSSWAQQPAPPTPPSPTQMAAHQVEHMATLLDLTSDQQTKATAIFASQATSMEGLKSSIDAAQAALLTAIKANDSAGISNAAAQLGSLHTQSVTANATAMASFYAILTSAQQAKVVSLGMLSGRGPGHGPGPGGPPPPPPGQ